MKNVTNDKSLNFIRIAKYISIKNNVSYYVLFAFDFFYFASGIDNFDNGAYKTGTVKHFNRTI